MRKGRNSLERVTGLTVEQVAGRKAGSMQQGGESYPPSSRTVVVQKDRLALTHDTAQSFEMIVKYIALAIKNRRQEVENALISTGSPKSVRNANPRRFNAIVQNRLMQKNEKGEAFRQLMSALVSGMYGRQLDNDKFFRIVEPKSSATGQYDILEAEYSAQTENIISLPTIPLSTIETRKDEPEILPLRKTKDGGVERNMDGEDWGNVLSGSAQVITAIGGVIGLFTGGQQTAEGDSAFDDYNLDQYGNGDNDNQKSGKGWIWGIVILVVIGVSIALIMKFGKGKNGK
jgi:hypothetical protein